MRVNMKKIAAFVLAGLLLLPACGINRDDLSGQDPTLLPESSSGVEVPERTEPDSAERILPGVTVETSHLQRYTEDGKTLLVEVYKDNLTLEGRGYEQAAETVHRLFYSDEEAVNRMADSLIDSAQEVYELQKDDWFSNYELTTAYEIMRLDTRILSVKGWTYEYTGGAHGNSGSGGITVDLESGQELELSHLMSDHAGFMDRAQELVLAELDGRKDELFEDYESYVRQNLETTGWYLNAAGIEFVFTPYEIGPYASGSITVCVPYGEAAEYMKPEYLVTQGEYIMALPAGREVTAGDSSVLIEQRQTGEYMDETFLNVNGTETSLGENVRLDRAFLMRRDSGRVFLVFDLDWASDDYETFVYELTADGAVQTANIWARLDGKNVNPENMNLIFSLDVLGTYSSKMRYELSEDGEFTALEDIYQIEANRQWQELVTKRELPVTVDGQESMLPIGSHIYITATDNAGTAYFEGTDAAGEAISGEIHYEWGETEFVKTIDGVDEFDYFVNLPYVG